MKTTQPNYLQQALRAFAETLHEARPDLALTEYDRRMLAGICLALADTLTGEAAFESGDPELVDQQRFRQYSARQILGSVHCALLVPAARVEFLATDAAIWLLLPELGLDPEELNKAVYNHSRVNFLVHSSACAQRNGEWVCATRCLRRVSP